MPWPCCCGGAETPVCTCCQTGTAPPKYRVTFTGIIEGTCGSCSDWNASFDLDYISPCYYKLDGGPCGPDPQVSLNINCGLGFTLYGVRIAENASASPAWYAEFVYVDGANPSDCSDTYDQAYTSQSGTLTCNYTGGSVHIEPLP